MGAALVDVDGAALRAAMGDHPLLLHHALAGDPHLSRAAFARLAEAHPRHLVEHHRGDLPLLLPTGEAEALPLTPREVVDGLDGNGSWMVLWSIDRVPPYGELVDEWLAPVRAATPPDEGEPGRAEALALLASPGAVVPAHVDNNHNVLVQVQGAKHVFTGEFRDAAEARRQVERRYGPARLNLDRLPETVTEWSLGPGDALYLPPFTVHWVVGGPDVSVAVSCSFTTPASRRAQDVHAWNARLRRLGVDPRAPGAGPWRDAAKVRALHGWLRGRRAAARARRRLRRQS